MKKEWYKFANQLNLSNETIEKEELGEMTRKQYERNVLSAIHREENGIQNNTTHCKGKKYRRATAAAACLVLLGSAAAIFHEEVYAAISRISYSLSAALGLGDDENKSLGGAISYDVLDIDLFVENMYELKLTSSNYDTAEEIDGHWDFRFKADGSELFADTKFMTLGNEFILPNGETVTLDVFSDNPIEQRITFHTSDQDLTGHYMVKVTATDEQGRDFAPF